MTYTGVIKGNMIEFDHHLPFDEGLHVIVNILAPTSPTKGSPQAWLKYFAGTLSREEADLIQFGVQEGRKIDLNLFQHIKDLIKLENWSQPVLQPVEQSVKAQEE